MIEGKSSNVCLSGGVPQARGIELIARMAGGSRSFQEIIVGVMPSFYNAD